MTLLASLDRFFRRTAPTAPGDLLVVAFSGGPDSAALLLGLTRLAERRGLLLHAAHLDHALDGESRHRADHATRLCRRLAVPVLCERRPVDAGRRPGESREAAARRMRYDFLEECRQRLGGRYVATAHHRDDQAETVLLRLLFGSGLEGLAAIAPRRGPIVRPLLDRSREELRRAVLEAGLEPADDPCNLDLATPRNRLRHLVLPHLRRGEPALDRRLTALARHAEGARRRIESSLAERLGLRRLPQGAALERRALAGLPEPLWPYALAALHRAAGAGYPPPRAARRALRERLGRPGRVGCDCGRGWRWESEGKLLRLRRHPPPAAPFSYTLEVPGTVEIPEIGARVRMRRTDPEPWMLEGSPERAGLSLALRAGDAVTVRSRRPGDRIKPLGCSYQRRLKDLLIDRKVPKDERGRLPLLCVGGRLAWVPGLTVEDDFRIGSGHPVWTAEIERA